MKTSWFHTLSFRVVIGSIALLLILFSCYSYIAIKFYGDQMTKRVVESAERMSDVISKSTRYSMLLNRTEDVYQTITTIAKEPGVEGIRIYNKRGVIIFSTDKNEELKVVNMKAEACFACHDQEKPLESLPQKNRWRIYESGENNRIVGLINPIRNEASCSEAECHAHPAEKKILGVLDVRMSLAGLDASLHQAKQTMILYAVASVIIVGLLSAFFLSLTIIRPLHTLMKGVGQVSSGNLTFLTPVTSKDEVGRLAHSFNQMTLSLLHEKQENEQWASVLQERIREKTEQLESIHKQVLHIEKMASLGKLASTVAHELNNPLEAILTYARVIARRLKKDPVKQENIASSLEDIEFIANETSRCGNIVKNLLLFSKKQVAELAIVPVRQVVEKATHLMQHHFAISNVTLETDFAADDPRITCDENQIQQALIALFVNAVEAMQGGGTLRVRTLRQPDRSVTIEVSDSGMGIQPEDLQHIFEPFFTTKQDGKGVGLGLSVVFGIVDRHSGKISVDSRPGKGTTFVLSFPPPESAPGNRPGGQEATPNQSTLSGVHS
jgi:two-component system NtrC family sensor kinase